MERKNLFVGITFIFFGIFFLLNNLNIVDFSIWHAISDLWPLFLVIFGLQLITEKTYIHLMSWILFFGIIILYAIFKQNNGLFIPYNFKNLF